jgi:uncharacterized protein affecting Mg2+/Co2+ transport
MKKLLLLFVLLFGVQCYSQNIVLQESEVAKLLCKKWQLKYGKSNGQQISGLEAVDDQYEFKADKTYTLGSNASYTTGTWKYNSKKRRIELSSGNEATGYIKSIREREFILVPGEKSIPANFKIEFHFEPGL